MLVRKGDKKAPTVAKQKLVIIEDAPTTPQKGSGGCC